MDLHPGEEIVFEGHPSWRSTLRFYVLGLLGAAVIGALVGLVTAPTTGSLVWLVLFAGVLAVGFFKRVSTTYVVSSQRLYIRRGLLAKRVQQTRIDRVQNVNTDQGPLERMLRVGTVDFERLHVHRDRRSAGDRHRRRSRAARAGPAAAALSRCFGDGDELYAAYHDDEWGRPVRDERGLFERLSLEAFQSGLSWLTILRKRDAFRAAFADFDPDVVATYGAVEAGRLLGDAGIVRNRLKIQATIANARATVALREAGTPLPELVAAHAPAPRPAPASFADVPAQTAESRALAKALRAAGFRFVGPTTLYALMQATGFTNDHLAGCPVRGEVALAISSADG